MVCLPLEAHSTPRLCQQGQRTRLKHCSLLCTASLHALHPGLRQVSLPGHTHSPVCLGASEYPMALSA